MISKKRSPYDAGSRPSAKQLELERRLEVDRKISNLTRKMEELEKRLAKAERLAGSAYDQSHSQDRY